MVMARDLEQSSGPDEDADILGRMFDELCAAIERHMKTGVRASDFRWPADFEAYWHRVRGEYLKEVNSREPYQGQLVGNAG